MPFAVRQLVVALAGCALCAAAMCAVARAAADDLFRQAAGHYSSKRWQQACDDFARLLQESPEHSKAADARFYWGESLVQLERWQAAREQFAALVRHFPNSRHAAQAQFRQGEASYLLADDERALRELADFNRAHPEHALNAFALVYLGNLALQARDAETARRHFAAALAGFPRGPLTLDAQLGTAQAAHQSNRLEDAARGYRAVAATNKPQAEQALLLCATAENARGNYPQALAALDELQRRWPQTRFADKARLAQGYALHKLGREPEAIDTLRPLLSNEARRVEAGYWLALAQKADQQYAAAAETLTANSAPGDHHLADAIAFHLAESLEKAGEVEQAAEQYERLTRDFAASPLVDDALLGKLRIAIARNDHEAALAAADTLAARFPQSPFVSSAQLAKGRALVELNRPADAKAVLESLASEPRAMHAELQGQVLAALALCQARLGEFAAAEETLDRLVHDKSAAEWADKARYQVAELAAAAGNKPLAEKLFAGLTQAGSNGEVALQAQASLAWNHFEAGRWAEALAACETVLARQPAAAQAAEAALVAGRSLEHLEQFDRAQEMYRQVIEKYPDTKRAAEALWSSGRLYEQTREPRQAIERYALLAEKHRDFAQRDAALLRQAALVRASDPAAAETILARLKTEHPDSEHAGEADLRLAEQAFEQQDYEAAAKLLAPLTHGDANERIRPAALYQAGRLAIAQGNWGEAETLLEQLAGTTADEDLKLRGEYLLGEAGFRQGKFEQAARRLAGLAEKTKNQNDAWLATAELRRAQALAQLRRWDEAEDLCSQSLERFADFDQRYEFDYLIGRAAVAGAEFAKAREHYMRVLAAPEAQNSETAAMARWMIGESYFHQEDFKQALAAYQRVDPSHPKWHAAALMQSGKCAEALGRAGQASECYQRLLQEHPKSELTTEAQTRLTALERRADAGKPLKQK